MSDPTSDDRPTLRARLLRVFADVRPGEAAVTLLLALDIFLTITAYYVLKVVREPLILVQGGAEVKTYASGAQALLLLLVVVPLYGALARRVGRMRLINVVSVIILVCLVGFMAFGQAGVPIGVEFFIWMGMFNLMIVAQFWSFANDLFSAERGKRLFPLIAAGGTLGGIAGAQLGERVIGPLGPYATILVATVILCATIVITNVIHVRARRMPVHPAEKNHADAPIGGTRGGFRLLLDNRYLLLIGLLVLVYNTVNTTGEYILSKVVKAHAVAAAAGAAHPDVMVGRVIGEFYGNFFTWVNVVTAIVQLFLVSRLIKYAGVRMALLVLPVVALGGYGLILAYPLLGAVKAVKIVENSCDYSVQNTARQTLFLPTRRDAKYKAKVAIDTFCVRFGDVLTAVLVFAGTQAGLALPHFAMINLILVVSWIVLAVAIGVRWTRLERGLPDEPTPAREGGALARASSKPVPA